MDFLGIIFHQMENNSNQKSASVLGRWQPLHLGHQAVLLSICQAFDHVKIGIGSANIQDYRNPFTLEEVTEMLKLTLKEQENIVLTPIHDCADERLWCQDVRNKFAQTPCLITANPYVKAILHEEFTIVHPVYYLPVEKRIPISGTQVRMEMARGNGWKQYVPDVVQDFILDNRIDQRFRKYFGLQTIAMDAIIVE